MQYQKDEVRDKVIAVARHEFLSKGFKGTSMRAIAAKSGVSLSNIYNYFHSKDKIFREVLSGLLNAINKAMEEHNEPRFIDIGVFTSEEYIRSQIELFVQLINTYKDDFKLLFFKSSGSQLEDYREKIIDAHTKKSKEYLLLMKEKYPDINTEISDFFIHTMSAWAIGVFSELVMHNLTKEELKHFITNYMQFNTAGWQRILQVNLTK